MAVQTAGDPGLVLRSSQGRGVLAATILGSGMASLDGTVETLAIGSDQQHAAFAGKLRQGPRAARVDEVTELPAEPVDGLTTFRIEGAW